MKFIHIITFYSFSCAALYGQVSSKFPLPQDVSSIDGIMKAYYDVVSGPAGQPRQWERDNSLHHPSALVGISGKDREGKVYMNTMTLAEYHKGDAVYANGFFESEINREVRKFGNIAHVWSTYETRRTIDGPIIGRGINSIQLYFDGTRWWIMSWIFDSERKDNLIPETFNPK